MKILRKLLLTICAVVLGSSMAFASFYGEETTLKQEEDGYSWYDYRNEDFKYGAKNLQGEMIVPDIYNSVIYYPTMKAFKARKGEFEALYEPDGRCIINENQGFCKLHKFKRENNFYYYEVHKKIKKNEYYVGIYDAMGREIIPVSRGYCEVNCHFSHGVLEYTVRKRVKKNIKEGLCDMYGKEIVAPVYSEALYTETGAAVKDTYKDKWRDLGIFFPEYEGSDYQAEIEAYLGGVSTVRNGVFDLIVKANDCYKAKDYKNALELYKKAIAMGNIDACYSVGSIYNQGLGVKKDDAQALEWWEKGAQGGNEYCMYSMAVYYGYEKKPQDYKKAMEWYMKASAEDFSPAQFALGTMYRDGTGVTKDLPEARKWFELALGNGMADAKAEIDKINKVLNPPVAKAATPSKPKSAATAQSSAKASSQQASADKVVREWSQNTGFMQTDYKEYADGRLVSTSRSQCFACHGRAKCQLCGGGGVQYAYTGNRVCGLCFGSGQCSACQGKGVNIVVTVVKDGQAQGYSPNGVVRHAGSYYTEGDNKKSSSSSSSSSTSSKSSSATDGYVFKKDVQGYHHNGTEFYVVEIWRNASGDERARLRGYDELLFITTSEDSRWSHCTWNGQSVIYFTY